MSQKFVMPRRSAGTTRRIQVAPIVGAGLGISQDAADQIQQTLENKNEKETRRDYQWRLKRICDFLLEKHPQYAEHGVIELTEEQKAILRTLLIKEFKYLDKYQETEGEQKIILEILKKLNQ